MVSPNGVVIENWRSVPPSSVNVWMSSIDVPPRSLEQPERLLDVLDLEDQRADAVGVLAQEARTRGRPRRTGWLTRSGRCRRLEDGGLLLAARFSSSGDAAPVSAKSSSLRVEAAARSRSCT